jgi:predicted amino acid dehydrogenase
MKKFAFIIHPLALSDFYRKYDLAKKVPDTVLKKVIKFLPPIKVSQITGIKSKTGQEVEGYFVACPLTSEQMINLPEDFVIDKIVRAGKKAEKIGVDIIGLGAFTSVVGDKGITIANRLNLPVTTGNSYTVGTAVKSIRMAADQMNLNINKEIITVVGATGSIGRTVSMILGNETKKIQIVARNEEKLVKLKKELRIRYQGLDVILNTDVKNAVNQSRIIVSASGAANSLIEPNDLLPAAVVCDVARPRDVANKVTQKRDDILVIEGGIVSVPGDVNFNFDFGYPPGTSYACMAETIILTLEEEFVNYTLGSKVKEDKVNEMMQLADKHGFSVANLRGANSVLSARELKKMSVLV